MQIVLRPFFTRKNVLQFLFQVLVTHPNKQPARNVRVLILVNVTRNGIMEEKQKFDRDNVNARAFTDEHGEADFVLDSCSNCQLISLKVQKLIFSKRASCFVLPER